MQNLNKFLFVFFSSVVIRCDERLYSFHICFLFSLFQVTRGNKECSIYMCHLLSFVYTYIVLSNITLLQLLDLCSRNIQRIYIYYSYHRFFRHSDNMLTLTARFCCSVGCWCWISFSTVDGFKFPSNFCKERKTKIWSTKRGYKRYENHLNKYCSEQIHTYVSLCHYHSVYICITQNETVKREIKTFNFYFIFETMANCKMCECCIRFIKRTKKNWTNEKRFFLENTFHSIHLHIKSV